MPPCRWIEGLAPSRWKTARRSTWAAWRRASQLTSARPAARERDITLGADLGGNVRPRSEARRLALEGGVADRTRPREAGCLLEVRDATVSTRAPTNDTGRQRRNALPPLVDLHRLSWAVSDRPGSVVGATAHATRCPIAHNRPGVPRRTPREQSGAAARGRRRDGRAVANIAHAPRVLPTASGHAVAYFTRLRRRRDRDHRPRCREEPFTRCASKTSAA